MRTIAGLHVSPNLAQMFNEHGACNGTLAPLLLGAKGAKYARQFCLRIVADNPLWISQLPAQVRNEFVGDSLFRMVCIRIARALPVAARILLELIVRLGCAAVRYIPIGCIDLRDGC